MSFCLSIEKEATRMERRPNPIMMFPARCVPKEPSTRTLHLTRAYRAIFKRRPDRTADMGVGPSAWASGSQL